MILNRKKLEERGIKVTVDKETISFEFVDVNTELSGKINIMLDNMIEHMAIHGVCHDAIMDAIYTNVMWDRLLSSRS